MTTFIVGGMPLDDEFVREIIYAVPEKDRKIIACDKGYFHLNKASISPDLIIGDFDSAGEDLYNSLVRDGKNVIKLNPVKDDTDVEAALKYAFDNTDGDIVILGAIGGRVDHTLGNIALLGMGLKNGRKVYLQNGTNRIQMVEGGQTAVLNKPSYLGYVSVFPYGGQAEGVTMEGFKYPLKDAVIQGFSTLTVSNEIVADTASIFVRSGYLIIVESCD